MKIIFLDFDGVLNSSEFIKEVEKSDDTDHISEEMVSRINHIIEETGAKVVISSSWRAIRSLDELREVLEKCGFQGDIIGETPRKPSNHLERGDMIRLWLDENPGWDDFVVLDDDSDMYSIPDGNFIRTNFHTGITDKDAEKAIEVLQ